MLISKFPNCDVKEQIADMEKRYEIILPVQYKSFLHKYNGGYTPETKFKSGKISSDVRGFFGIGDVKLSLNTIELEEWIEKNVFPIACDSFGNYMVIGLRNDNLGKVYFCDHEKGRGSIITDGLRKMWQAEIDKYGNMIQEEVY